jgi:hypothetical protein
LSIPIQHSIQWKGSFIPPPSSLSPQLNGKKIDERKKTQHRYPLMMMMTKDLLGMRVGDVAKEGIKKGFGNSLFYS